MLEKKTIVRSSVDKAETKDSDSCGKWLSMVNSLKIFLILKKKNYKLIC